MASVVLSVRGEAERLVEPDDVTLSCQVTAVGGSKADALRSAAAVTEVVVADLVQAGGRALRPETRRHPLVWSRRSAGTEPQRDPETYQPTGRTSAHVAVVVVARDLAGLDALMALLARHELLHVQDVSWSVDDDNRAWPQVRAEAVAAALQRGRDYAAALGGALVSVEQVADVGLLGSGAPAASSSRMQFFSAEQSAPQTPSLDPVPQQLWAAVEARLTADVPDLPVTG